MQAKKGKATKKIGDDTSMEYRLKAAGIVVGKKWKDKGREALVLGRALSMINKRLNSLGVLVEKREQLVILRAELLRELTHSGCVSVVSGGLPGLGKRK